MRKWNTRISAFLFTPMFYFVPSAWGQILNESTKLLVSDGVALTRDASKPVFDLNPHDNSGAESDVQQTAQIGSACACAPGFHVPDLDQPASALAVFDDGTGPTLYVGGGFTTAGDVIVNGLARWDGTTWSSLGSGLARSNPLHQVFVQAMTVFDDSTGEALYVGGLFETAGGVIVNHIAKWDGVNWTSLRSGVNNGVDALAVFDDGTGLAMFAGGFFITADGVTVNHIAKWDGQNWSPLADGVNSQVRALTVFDDGSGPALYAGGPLSAAGGVTTLHIAKWDGSTWSAVGGGMEPGGTVNAITVFDDGTGSRLYAGGFFTIAGGNSANRIAKWDGSIWSQLGTGLNGPVAQGGLTEFDDGGGPALYASGAFTTASGIEASKIAKWDGSTWSALGSGLSRATSSGSGGSLTVFDDGGGGALYAGGDFTRAGGVPANGFAKWNGTTWSPLNTNGNGMDDSVFDLTVFDDGTANALYAGGEFTSAGGISTSFIAKWDGLN